MASIKSLSGGRFRAFIYVQGLRESKTFYTRRDAQLWAAQRELELYDLATKPKALNYTLGEALTKYREEVTPTRKGARWEEIRIKAFEKYFLPLDKPLGEVTTKDIEVFRDSRLKAVSSGSVKRELSLLSAVFTSAKFDWKWGNENPIQDMRIPKEGPSRERVYEWWEVKRMLRGFGYAPGKKVTSTYQAVGACLMLALRTGMRAGELCNLTWDNVHASSCFLPDTKNGTSRKVPLSSRAKRILEQLRGRHDEKVLNLTPQSLDVNFRAVRKKANLEGFTFHDSRHTAATMLARKFTALELCRVFGWKDPRMALRYFNPTVDELAAKLG